jgi:hypothetical protein
MKSPDLERYRGRDWKYLVSTIRKDIEQHEANRGTTNEEAFLNQARDASQSLYHSGEEPRRVVVKDVALLRRIQERRS